MNCPYTFCALIMCNTLKILLLLARINIPRKFSNQYSNNPLKVLSDCSCKFIPSGRCTQTRSQIKSHRSHLPGRLLRIRDPNSASPLHTDLAIPGSASGWLMVEITPPFQRHRRHTTAAGDDATSFPSIIRGSGGV